MTSCRRGNGNRALLHADAEKRERVMAAVDGINRRTASYFASPVDGLRA